MEHISANLEVRPPVYAQNEHNSTVFNGKRYQLDVIQEPVRARMCGFGDKDRRPITPPPCVRLRIFDAQTNQEIPVDEINSSFFVLTADLWNDSRTHEVNIVRHSNHSPAMSISASTVVSYPPPPERFLVATMATQYGAPAGGMYLVQQPPQQYAPPPQYNGYANGYANGQHQHQHPGSSSFDFAGQQQQQQQGMVHQAPFAGQGHPQIAYAHLPPQPVAHPQGSHTRNLIGSLAVPASKLKDEKDELGIWFVFQDLSVRTEGHFCLKFAFVDVNDPATPGVPTHDESPILATIFSQSFQVYSAKKFPGVIESTALSKAFAAQGVKIPIRKDAAKNANAEDFEDDNDDPSRP
jgi:hypothetical protein